VLLKFKRFVVDLPSGSLDSTVIISSYNMPLKIIVVGAGIAGLVAAVSLEQAGHHVKVNQPVNLLSF
jgi:NADPH-dependent 2,4-dienoyl-CoA reductase/sulfur reductase-like enzyme